MSELLRVEGLKKYFKTPKGQLHAVDDVSFSIEKENTGRCRRIRMWKIYSRTLHHSFAGYNRWKNLF